MTKSTKIDLSAALNVASNIPAESGPSEADQGTIRG